MVEDFKVEEFQAKKCISIIRDFGRSDLKVIARHSKNNTNEMPKAPASLIIQAPVDYRHCEKHKCNEG